MTYLSEAFMSHMRGQQLMFHVNSQVSGAHRCPIDDIPNGHLFSQDSHCYVFAPQATDCLPTSSPPARSGSTFSCGDRDPQWRRLPAGLMRQGSPENTRVPWGASQGTLVPCVTTPGPHA